MKKTLLLLAAAFVSMSAFSQTVTKVSADGSDNTFKLPANSHVYAIFKLNDGMKEVLGLDDAHYTYIGEDADEGRNLWNWQSKATNPGGPQSAAPNKNSFGQVAQFYNMAGATGWSGWGLNVDKTHPIDLSGIGMDYNFHFAIKQTKRTTSPSVSITDGDGHAATFTFGTGTDELNAPADGNWYSVDISCADLLDIFGVDFSTPANKTYNDKNLFTFTWGGAPDNLGIDYAAFFYGPESATNGITDIQKAEEKDDKNAPVYNLAGQRVSHPSHGIFIKNGKKFFAK